MLSPLSPGASKSEVIIFTVNLPGAFFINKTTQFGGWGERQPRRTLIYQTLKNNVGNEKYKEMMYRPRLVDRWCQNKIKTVT